MKFEIIEWAYEGNLPKELKSGPHAVLVALAYSAHYKTEACFPSIERLCDLTRLRPTAVKDALATLKRLNLITVFSGKGKKKSNRYKINYTKVNRKAKKKAKEDAAKATESAAKATENAPESAAKTAVKNPNVDNSVDNIVDNCPRTTCGYTNSTQKPQNGHEEGLQKPFSDQAISQNAATNISNCNYLNFSIAASSSNNVPQKPPQNYACVDDIMLQGENSDDDCRASSAINRSGMSMWLEGAYHPLHLGSGEVRPAGENAAKKTVKAWMEERCNKHFRGKLDAGIKKRLTQALVDALTIHTGVPGYADIEFFLDNIKNENDIRILEDTTKNVKQLAIDQNINSPRRYIREAFKRNIANGTAGLARLERQRRQESSWPF